MSGNARRSFIKKGWGFTKGLGKGLKKGLGGEEGEE